jgi:hypothetical protein
MACRLLRIENGEFQPLDSGQVGYGSWQTISGGGVAEGRGCLFGGDGRGREVARSGRGPRTCLGEICLPAHVWNKHTPPRVCPAGALPSEEGDRTRHKLLFSVNEATMGATWIIFAHIDYT